VLRAGYEEQPKRMVSIFDPTASPDQLESEVVGPMRRVDGTD
jgi:hypothetical protein